jgi:hypothetical protein
MPIESGHSTTLYTLGRGILWIGDWNVATPPVYPTGFKDVGNCPDFSVEVTEEVLPHYSSRSGIRKKDKTVTLEAGYTVKFSLDEKSVKNLQMFLRASVVNGHVLYANKSLSQEYALVFVSDNPEGPNEKWFMWRMKLTPAGPMALIGEEWMSLTFNGEGLADSEHHSESEYFTVRMVTTTTEAVTTTTA